MSPLLFFSDLIITPEENEVRFRTECVLGSTFPVPNQHKGHIKRNLPFSQNQMCEKVKGWDLFSEMLDRFVFL